MAPADPLRDDLTVYGGRGFGPYGWVLRDPQTGEPVRSGTGLTARAVIRAHPRAAAPLAEFDAQIVELRLPDDELPVAAVLLTATAAAIANWTWRTGVYDVVIDRVGQANPPSVEGRVHLTAGVSP